MPKNPNLSFGLERNVTGKDGHPKYSLDGKIQKEKVKMADRVLPDGTPQSFYYPKGHIKAGWFKEMVVILEERGYSNAQHIRAECPKFQCPKDEEHCSCHRMLYNKPDFVNVDSLLEITCRERGFQLIFLPKFHCKLNLIKQCWGYAKCWY